MERSLRSERTSDTTGTGIRVDGDLAVKTKSMNVDAFTQYNQGGVGVAVTNEGYAQLVSALLSVVIRQ